jgi:phage terminase large subunit
MDKLKVKRIATFSKFLTDNPKRILVVYGGRGSGKSHAVAQHLCRTFLSHKDLRILVTRKTLPALRITAFALIRDMLKAWGLPLESMLNKTELTIEHNDSQLLFKSLDDPEKIKSFEANLIWMEEATDFSREDFLQFNMRCARPGPVPNQMFLTFNPIDAFHWAVVDLIQGGRPDVAVHHSTYRDNPFLQQEICDQLVRLENIDRNFYRIYTLGEPGMLEHIIYSNYTVESFDMFPGIVKQFPPGAIGLDFGFNNPTGMVGIWLHDGEYYLHEILYRSGMTNKDLIGWMRSAEIAQGIPIPADSSRPDQIEELCREGWNIVPADKRSVKEGIDFVKSQRLHISTESVNLLKEIRAYSYRETKDGRVLDEPVDFMNHLVDAMRYGIYTTRHRSHEGDGEERSFVRGDIPSIYSGGVPDIRL